MTKNRLIILVGCLACAVVFVALFLVPAFKGSFPIPGGWRLGPLNFRIYSLLIFIGIVAAFFAAKGAAAARGIGQNHFENLIFLNVVFGLIGSRIYHVISSWDFYRQDLISVLYFWRGGLGIFGGIAAGLLTTYIYCRVRKLNFLSACDSLSLGTPLALAIGRWGNFFNQEAYGFPTALPWKMYIAPAYRLPALESFNFFHPLFLYESILDVAVFLLLYKISRNLKAGRLFGSFLILYSVGRLALSYLRADLAGTPGLLFNQISAVVLFVLGVLVIWRSRAFDLAARRL